MRQRLSMVALQAFLVALATPFVRFFADASGVIEDLKNQLVETHNQMKNIQAKADGEKRRLTEDEDKLIRELSAKFEDIEAQIERREDIDAKAAKLSAGQGRRTDPGGGGANAEGGRQPGRTRPAFESDQGKWGWNSFGEFAQAVVNGARKGATLDPRLVANAPTTISTEGTGADGGFAVPPDFRQEIMTKVMGEQSLIGRTDQQTSSTNGFTVPKDETTPWQTTGGIQAYWESEAGQAAQSKLSLESTTVKLNKLFALVPVTEELMSDAPSLSNYLRKKAPGKIDFRVTDAIVNGTGAGMPLGLIASGAKIAVAAEAGQSADTIVFANIVKMWARFFSQCRPNGVWLINQDIETQLMTMQFPGTGTAVPAYLPAGGLSASPFATLLGKPVIATEACQTLGDEGDIILTDLTQYLTCTKVGGIRQEVSIHLWFDYDITAFKFVLRVGGQPWWNTPVTPKNGSNTRSCTVTLAAR